MRRVVARCPRRARLGVVLDRVAERCELGKGGVFDDGCGERFAHGEKPEAAHRSPLLGAGAVGPSSSRKRLAIVLPTAEAPG